MEMVGAVRFESSGPSLAPYWSGRHSDKGGAGANNMPGLACDTAAASELSACLSPRIGLSVLGLALANPTEQHVLQPVAGPTHTVSAFLLHHLHCTAGLYRLQSAGTYCASLCCPPKSPKVVHHVVLGRLALPGIRYLAPVMVASAGPKWPQPQLELYA